MDAFPDQQTCSVVCIVPRSSTPLLLPGWPLLASMPLPLHACSTSLLLSAPYMCSPLSPSCIIYFTVYWITLTSLKGCSSFQLKIKNLASIFPLRYCIISVLLFMGNFLKEFSVILFSLPHHLPSTSLILTSIPFSKTFFPSPPWDQSLESH